MWRKAAIPARSAGRRTVDVRRHPGCHAGTLGGRPTVGETALAGDVVGQASARYCAEVSDSVRHSTPSWSGAFGGVWRFLLPANVTARDIGRAEPGHARVRLRGVRSARELPEATHQTIVGRMPRLVVLALRRKAEFGLQGRDLRGLDTDQVRDLLVRLIGPDAC